MPNRNSQNVGQAGSRPTASRTGAGSTARNEIIAMLKDDHKQVKKAFRDFEKLDPHEDPASCESLVQQTCSALEVHATLEEELFYPAARACLADEELIDEAEVEHTSLKSLIGQLGKMSPGDGKYSATFKVLGEYVKHHIKEEEGEIFPQLSRARLDWEELQAGMIERRSELEAKYQPRSAAGKKPPASGSGERRRSTMPGGAATSLDEDEA